MEAIGFGYSRGSSKSTTRYLVIQETAVCKSARALTRQRSHIQQGKTGFRQQQKPTKYTTSHLFSRVVAVGIVITWFSFHTDIGHMKRRNGKCEERAIE